jgi:hypothetical protein
MTAIRERRTIKEEDEHEHSARAINISREGQRLVYGAPMRTATILQFKLRGVP